MSSGFRHWIWYAIHSNRTFSRGGSRGCEQQELDNVRNEEVSLDLMDGFTSSPSRFH